MIERVRSPADIELEDRLAFGLTFRQLTILSLAALLGYGVFTLASSLLPLPLAAAAVPPVALAGTVLALGRRDCPPAYRLALIAASHLPRPRRRVLAPEGIPSPLPGAPARRSVALLDLPVRTPLGSGLVELTDGGFCQLLRASSTSFELRSEEEQAALVEAFGRFLNSVADPIEIVVSSEPVDLEARATALERAAQQGSPTRRCGGRPSVTTSSSAAGGRGGGAPARDPARSSPPAPADRQAAHGARAPGGGGDRAAARRRRRAAPAARRGGGQPGSHACSTRPAHPPAAS